MAAPSRTPVDDLLAALREAGLRVGVSETLRVGALLESAARGSGSGLGTFSLDIEGLHDLIACAVVTTQSDRATFDRVFDAWRAATLAALERERPALQAPSPVGVSPRIAQGPANRPIRAPRLDVRRFRRAILPAFLAVALAAALAFALYIATHRDPPPAPPEVTDAASPAMTAAPEDAPRPGTFAAPTLEFTIEPPTNAGAARALGVVALAGLAAACVLWLLLRKKRWLPPILPGPSLSGPPELPLLPLRDRSAGLLDASERDDLAFAVDRFLRDEPSRELDVLRSINATIAEGGRLSLVFRRATEHRTVWLWVDAAAKTPLVARFAAEIRASLTASGLPCERASYWLLPHSLEAEDGGSLLPHDLDDVAEGSAVLVLTDGAPLAERLAEPAALAFASPVLRLLARFPRAAIVAVDREGRRVLAPIARRFGVDLLAPDDVGAFLAGQDGARKASSAAVRIEGDVLAWAAACSLSERPVDLPTALALHKHLGLRASPWTFNVVLAQASTSDGRFAASDRARRATWLRWLSDTVRRGTKDKPIPEGSLAARALGFWRNRLENEERERIAQETAERWPKMPAARRLRRERLLLDLWDDPESAAVALYKLFGGLPPEERAKTLASYAARVAPGLRGAAPPSGILLPWTLADLGDDVRVIFQELGLRAFGAPDEPRFLQRPGRLILALGLILGLVGGGALGSLALWLGRSTSAPRCSAPEGVWCSVALSKTGAYLVAAGSGRVLISTTADVAAGSTVLVTKGEETRYDCVNPAVQGGARLYSCGLRDAPTPREASFKARRSVGVVVSSPESKDARDWSDALLDSGSADLVFVSPPGLVSDLLALFAVPAEGAVDQLLVVMLDNSSGELPPQRALDRWGEGRSLVAILQPQIGANDLVRFRGTAVRRVVDIWPSASIRGEPLLAGIAAAQAPLGSAPPPDSILEPSGPIKNSSECPRRDTEEGGMVFVRVCGGIFMMGSNDAGADNDEMPPHQVQISTFWMGKYEVSAGEFNAWKGGPALSAAEARLPATGVDWNDASDFCISRGNRLPTEAEWEYAARGPEGRKYPWGSDEPTEKFAAFGGVNAVEVTAFKDVPSPFGTVNQAGNAWEWVWDSYDANFYKKADHKVTTDPLNSRITYGERVLRGGSFEAFPRFLRSTCRYSYAPVGRYWRVGFRCARGSARQHRILKEVF